MISNYTGTIFKIPFPSHLHLDKVFLLNKALVMKEYKVGLRNKTQQTPKFKAIKHLHPQQKPTADLTPLDPSLFFLFFGHRCPLLYSFKHDYVVVTRHQS